MNIRAISCAVPAHRQELSGLPWLGAASAKRIGDVTGIHSVRWLSSGDFQMLAREAVGELQQDGVDVPTCDALIVVTQTPGAGFPSPAHRLHGSLSLSQDVPVFDFPLGCSGYLYGLNQAQLLLNGGYERILLVVGDVISPHLRSEDRTTRTILGDAVSASWITSGSAASPFVFASTADTAPSLYFDQERMLRMDGAEVFQFAAQTVPALIRKLLQENDLTVQGVGVCLLHQANALLVRHLGSILGFPEERVPVALDGYGNTGSASIPLLLCLRGNTLRMEIPLHQSILCGFGIGWSAVATRADFSGTRFLTPVEVG